MVKTVFKHSFLEDKIWRFENVYITKVGILLQNTPCDYLPKGVYPQSDDSTQWGRRYPSKRMIAQWEHLSFAIFAIFDQKRQLKLLEKAFDQVQTCLIFPFRWAHFPIKDSRKTQWVHPFSMNFNGFRSVCLYFSLKVHFRLRKWSFNGNTIYFR